MSRARILKPAGCNYQTRARESSSSRLSLEKAGRLDCRTRAPSGPATRDRASMRRAAMMARRSGARLARICRPRSSCARSHSFSGAQRLCVSWRQCLLRTLQRVPAEDAAARVHCAATASPHLPPYGRRDLRPRRGAHLHGGNVHAQRRPSLCEHAPDRGFSLGHRPSYLRVA